MTQITLENTIIEKDRLKINCEHTSFVDLERFTRVDSFALLRRYQALVKEAKASEEEEREKLAQALFRGI